MSRMFRMNRRKKVVVYPLVFLLTAGISVMGFFGFLTMDHSKVAHDICIGDTVRSAAPAMETSALCAQLHLNLVYEIAQAITVDFGSAKVFAIILLFLASVALIWLRGQGDLRLKGSSVRQRLADSIFYLFLHIRYWLALFEKCDPLRRRAAVQEFSMMRTNVY